MKKNKLKISSIFLSSSLLIVSPIIITACTKKPKLNHQTKILDDLQQEKFLKQSKIKYVELFNTDEPYKYDADLSSFRNYIHPRIINSDINKFNFNFEEYYNSQKTNKENPFIEENDESLWELYKLGSKMNDFYYLFDDTLLLWPLSENIIKYSRLSRRNIYYFSTNKSGRSNVREEYGLYNFINEFDSKIPSKINTKNHLRNFVDINEYQNQQSNDYDYIDLYNQMNYSLREVLYKGSGRRQKFAQLKKFFNVYSAFDELINNELEYYKKHRDKFIKGKYTFIKENWEIFNNLAKITPIYQINFQIEPNVPHIDEKLLEFEFLDNNNTIKKTKISFPDIKKNHN